MFIMQKLSYEKPVMEIIRFETEDVICTSGLSNGYPGGTAPDFGWDDSWGTGDNWGN